MKTKLSNLLPAAGLGLALIASSPLVAARPGGPYPDGPGGPGARLQQLDQNGDGQITTAEIEAGAANEALAIDTNGDGLIRVEELIAMHERKRLERITARLNAADADGNGNISLAEFANQHTARTLRLDRDGNGIISEDEQRPPRHGARAGKP